MSWIDDFKKKGWKVSFDWQFGGKKTSETVLCSLKSCWVKSNGKHANELCGCSCHVPPEQFGDVIKVKLRRTEKKYDPQDNQGAMG